MTAKHTPTHQDQAGSADLFGIDLREPGNATTPPTDLPSTFGHRLRAAREARGVAVETCAQALKLPARVLRQLEHDACDEIDSKIYLGSYIAKYGRYLDIDESAIQQEVERIRHVEPTLVATGGISHSRFLLDRYATAATYVVFTALIVVPMIWLGVRGTLDRSITHLAPLDASPVAQQDAPVASSSAGKPATGQPAPLAVASTPTAPSLPAVAPQDQPLLASMAPFPGLDHDTAPAAPPVALPADDTVGSGSHSLQLTLTAASWVEVIDKSGARLEYGLLPAGTSKTFRSDQPLDVRIGNATGATIAIDGQPVAMNDFRHANVAHFRVQMQDGKASAASL